MTLKNALETLLGAPCHHMAEVFGRKEKDVPAFAAAARGDFPDWDELFDGYAAAVDWPASAFYAELADHYPDAVVVLSRRDSFETWWTSTSNTVLKHFDGKSGAYPEDDGGWEKMVQSVWTYSLGGTHNDDLATVEAGYHRYHEKVRETIPSDRLIEFETGAGWEPLCDALGLPVPDEPFPHLNSTKEFLSRVEQIKAGE